MSPAQGRAVAADLRGADRTIDPAGSAAEPQARGAGVTTHALSALCLLADEHGVDCAPWFAGLRLTRERVDHPETLVSHRQACSIVRLAVQSMPLADLGLTLGMRQNVGNYGVLGLAMMAARSFGDALRLGVAYAPLAGKLMDLQLVGAGPGQVALVASPRAAAPDILHFLCEELFAGMLSVCRDLAGPGLKPCSLALTYAAPAHVVRYRTVFDCPLRFGASCNRMAIDAAWMDYALPSYNPVNARHAAALCRQLMAGIHDDGETVAAVRSLLRARLADAPRLNRIASELHYTERSLRRRLVQAGTGFQQLHDQVRSERALELLQGTHAPIAQIGALLGFHDTREFRRAFKRWTGMSPLQARSRPPCMIA